MKKNILFIIILMKFITAHAQDIHFSQFYVNQLLLNPAKTGFFDGSYRLSGIYRNQWAAVTVPYQTFAFSGEYAIQEGNQNILGLGLMATNDKAGDGNLTTTQFGASLAYNKALDMSNRFYLGYGMMGTYTTSNIDISKLYFEDQWEGGGTADLQAANASHYFDASAGLEWSFLANENENFEAGVSIYHVNEPVATYMSGGTGKIYRKYSFNAGALLPVAESFSILPKIYYNQQLTLHELVYGGLVRYNFSNSASDINVYFGVMQRWKDAVLAITRLDWNNLGVGLSFDINHSSLSKASFGSGGPELSLTWTGIAASHHTKKIYCPKF